MPVNFHFRAYTLTVLQLVLLIFKTSIVVNMFVANYDAEIFLLKFQIELEESNYKYAVELRKHPTILIRMREHIRELKEHLKNIQELSYS
jgi:hypothetical protein